MSNNNGEQNNSTDEILAEMESQFVPECTCVERRCRCVEEDANGKEYCPCDPCTCLVNCQCDEDCGCRRGLDHCRCAEYQNPDYPRTCGCEDGGCVCREDDEPCGCCQDDVKGCGCFVYQGRSEGVEPELTLPDLLGELEATKRLLAETGAELYNLKQEYANYVRRSKSDQETAKKAGQKQVISTLIAVLDDIYAAREAGELEGPFAAIATKLENTMDTNYQLQRFGEIGEIFDPMRHEALLANSSAEVTEPQVAQILQPGYALGEEVLRAAKVVVDNPA